jgi:uncharacterized protein YprB with RNaseH-like and TPR domain
MELERRLRTLIKESGRGGGSADGDLAARIRRLRPGSGSTIPMRRAGDEQVLLAASGGELLAPGLILVEQRVALDRSHGRLPLAWLAEPEPALAEAAGIGAAGLVFLDTETSGLAGGTGTQVFLLGLARLRGRTLWLRQYLLTRFSGEPELYRQARAWLGDARGLASFNGRSFDAPLLAARARLAGVADALDGLPHVDLLYPLRRAFSKRWPDCRLASAERRLLGFERRDDLPGSEAPRAWFDWLQRGDPTLLPRVLAHNRWDLVSLALLLPVLARVYREPAVWGADAVAIARGQLRAGRGDEALALLQGQRSGLDPDGLLLLAALLKRNGGWEQAGAIWRRLAAAGHSQASEELAKYHEHVTREFRLALDFAGCLPPGAERERRRQRLNRKLERLAKV